MSEWMNEYVHLTSVKSLLSPVRNKRQRRQQCVTICDRFLFTVSAVLSVIWLRFFVAFVNSPGKCCITPWLLFSKSFLICHFVILQLTYPALAYKRTIHSLEVLRAAYNNSQQFRVTVFTVWVSYLPGHCGWLQNATYPLRHSKWCSDLEGPSSPSLRPVSWLSVNP
jgi:hypothetical protein